MIERGIDRSETSTLITPSGRLNAGIHQASSIKSTAPPTAWPAMIPSPVLSGEPAL